MMNKCERILFAGALYIHIYNICVVFVCMCVHKWIFHWVSVHIEMQVTRGSDSWKKIDRSSSSKNWCIYGYFNMQRATHTHTHSKDNWKRSVMSERRWVPWFEALCNPHILFSFDFLSYVICMCTHTHTHTAKWDVRLALCQGNRSASAKWGIRRLRA